MYKRYILINFPGLGVGDLKNSSSSNHSLEQLLKYAHENSLNLDLTALEEIGLDAFVKYNNASARKSSVTARLAVREIHGTDDFSAFNEIGGGDNEHLPVYSAFVERDSDDAVFAISIGSDETLIPSYEFIESPSDVDIKLDLIDVVSAPLVRNEFIVATMTDYREAALEGNATLACACLSQLSKLVEELLPLLGTDDALMVVSSTAIDATGDHREFKNELTPMFYTSPVSQTNDLGLRLLSDIGPSIAEFFDIDKSNLIGASMAKWMKIPENPHEEVDSTVHS